MLTIFVFMSQDWIFFVYTLYFTSSEYKSEASLILRLLVSLDIIPLV